MQKFLHTLNVLGFGIVLFSDIFDICNRAVRKKLGDVRRKTQLNVRRRGQTQTLLIYTFSSSWRDCHWSPCWIVLNVHPLTKVHYCFRTNCYATNHSCMLESYPVCSVYTSYLSSKRCFWLCATHFYNYFYLKSELYSFITETFPWPIFVSLIFSRKISDLDVSCFVFFGASVPRLKDTRSFGFGSKNFHKYRAVVLVEPRLNTLSLLKLYIDQDIF